MNILHFCRISNLYWTPRGSSACPLGQGGRQQMQVPCATPQHIQACQLTAAKIIFLHMIKLITSDTDQIQNTPAVVSNQQKTQVIFNFESYCLPAWWQSTQLDYGLNLKSHHINQQQNFLPDFTLKPRKVTYRCLFY